MPGPLLAVDGPFVLYRSFFALPDSITGRRKAGQRAARGGQRRSCGSPLTSARGRSSSASEPRRLHYRVELYPPYHADRPPVPDALAWQFEQAPAFLEAFGWNVMTTEELEADDLLGSLAAVGGDGRRRGADPDR